MAIPPDNNNNHEVQDNQARVLMTGELKPGYKRTVNHQQTKSGFCQHWSKKKICCVSCLACVLVVVVVIVSLAATMFTMPEQPKDVESWEKRFQSIKASKHFKLDGTYDLKSYDEGYKDFLTSMGIPWFVIPLILKGSETIEMEIFEDGVTVRTKTITAFKTQEMFYKFNETWSMEYGKGMGVMWNFCTREAVNVILCRCEEREKDWRISSKLTFTDSAMVNERTFHNKNIVAKKYYEKRDPDTYVETTTAEEVDFWSEEKEDGSDEWSNFFDD